MAKHKILVDLDAIIYDVDKAINDEIERILGRRIRREEWKRYNIRDNLWGSVELERKVFEELSKKRFYRNAPLVNAAKEGLEFLNQRFAIVLSTSRKNFYKQAEEDTLTSLQKDKIPYLSIQFTSNGREKAEVARINKCLFAIEDNWDTASAISKICPCYLFHYSFNRSRKTPSNIIRVYGWREKKWWLNFMEIVK